MKIICSKSTLLKAVQLVRSVSGGKGTLPILSNILMEAFQDRVQLTATDLEAGVRYSFPAQVEKVGTCTIPARRLGDIVRELPPAEVEIEADEENKIIITCQKVTFKIVGLPSGEFPTLPEIERANAFKINQNLLASMLRKTTFAITHDETRYVLNGIYFIIDQNKIRMVATDGHRLAIADGQAIGYRGEQKGVVIPHKILNELSRNLGEGEEVEVAITPNQIFFRMNNFTMTSRLIEGEFPNYEQIIPKEAGRKMRADTTKLLEAVRRAALFAEARGNAVNLIVSTNKLVVEAQTPELGEAYEEIDVAFEGEENRVTYNARYLLDVLKNVGSPEVDVEFAGPLSPGVVRPSDGQEYLCIIMPMRGGS
jgi:DNA polymerase-3 subunit beta